MFDKEDNSTNILVKGFTLRGNKMVCQLVNGIVLIDRGKGKPDEVLHRREGLVWTVYRVRGQLVKHPIKEEHLSPGHYRMAKLLKS